MEPIVHLIIPTLVLIAFFPKLRNEIIYLVPTSILPDLDFFIQKRVFFHNIFFVIITTLLVYTVANLVFSEKKTGVKSRARTAKTLSLITLFFLSSHLLLDLWGPGIAILYPISNKLYGFNMNVYMSPATGKLSFELLRIENPAYEAVKDQKSPIFTMIGFSLLVMLVAIWFTTLIIKRWRIV